jgi:hypothetical protein
MEPTGIHLVLPAFIAAPANEGQPASTKIGSLAEQACRVASFHTKPADRVLSIEREFKEFCTGPDARDSPIGRIPGTPAVCIPVVATDAYYLATFTGSLREKLFSVLRDHARDF